MTTRTQSETGSGKAGPEEQSPLALWGGRIFDALGSYWLAVTILVALLVLTFLGTLEQRFRGLEDVQRDYFESFFHISRTIAATAEDPQGGFPIPVIGALPLLALLFINLIVGGILRLRKGSSTIGILIAHVGIGLLLLGCLVEHMTSTNGSMTINPGETSNYFVSYHDWDVVVSEYLGDGSGQEFVLPQDQFEDMDEGEQIRFHSPKLPFDVALSGYRRHAVPRPVPGGHQGGGIGGFLLQELPPAQEAAENVPGALATIRTEGEADEQVLLWGLQTGPYHFSRAGRRFGIDLRRKEWRVPFKLRLTRFVKEEHPGMAMAREFSSYLEKIEDGSSQNIHITMNEPLRHRGYIFYQSSYQPVGRGADGKLIHRTVLTVSTNPADRIPLIACIVIALGLLIHYCMKLYRHIKAENRRQTHAATA